MPDLDPGVRLDRLEKRLRMWKWATLTTMFLFIGVLTAMTSILWDLGEVRAHSITITGEDDTPRASLKVDKQGWVRLQVMDPKGNTRAAMEVGPDGASDVCLRDEKGASTAALK